MEERGQEKTCSYEQMDFHTKLQRQIWEVRVFTGDESVDLVKRL
jgi:hypothetical protein